MEIFDSLAKSKKLNGLQKIKGVIIETQGIESLDLYTSSFKKKRNMIQKMYKERFDKIYSKLNN